jgi:protein YibB
MKHDVSVVTAFFDIGRASWQLGKHASVFRRSCEQYLNWFGNLASLKNSMVIFTEERFADQVLALRCQHGLQSVTKIIVIENLFGAQGPLASQIASVSMTMRPELHAFVKNSEAPEFQSAKYVVLCLLKTVLVNTVIKLQLNNSPQVAWIDFGYCRDGDRFDQTVPWCFDCGDRMNMFYLREPDDRPIFDIIKSGDVYFQGCHLVGPQHTWSRLQQLVDEAVASLLVCGLIDDDQTALLMAYRRDPELFRIHAVDPSDWFVIFRKFQHFANVPADWSVARPNSDSVASVGSLEVFHEDPGRSLGPRSNEESPVQRSLSRGSAEGGYCGARFYGEGERRFGALLRTLFDKLANYQQTTELCEIMAHEGSDKGKGWHNYTVLYDLLFSDHRSRTRNLLEVGIGTNFTDIPSNVGAAGIPGASLRGWRTYFPEARVIGADVDKRVLFSEARISTFYVDQLNEDSIDDLLKNFSLIEFDIIVDDGLHTFEANSRFLTCAICKLASGGFYVIEDISTDQHNLEKYDALLQNTQLHGFMIQIPHNENRVDNCVAILQR